MFLCNLKRTLGFVAHKVLEIKRHKAMMLILGFIILSVFMVFLSGVNLDELSTNEKVQETENTNSSKTIVSTGPPESYHCPVTTEETAVVLRHLYGTGLGNQMFRYACSYALSRKLKVPMYQLFPPRILETLYLNQDNSLRSSSTRVFSLHHFNITFINSIVLDDCNSKRIYAFDDRLLFKAMQVKSSLLSLSEFPKNKLLMHMDYCQSDKFFLEVKEGIIEQFVLVDGNNMTIIQEALERIEGVEESIGIHIRLGDYLIPGRKEYEWATPLNFYANALKVMMKKLYFAKKMGRTVGFFIFTDDVDFVKRNFKPEELKGLEKVRLEFISGRGFSSLEEFYLMTKCRHFIVSNSTFSWWGAYLIKNKKKIIIGPKFSEKFYNHYETNAVREYKRRMNKMWYPEEWIILDPWNNSNIQQKPSVQLGVGNKNITTLP